MLSANVIATGKLQLAYQLIGRLIQHGQNDDIGQLLRQIKPLGFQPLNTTHRPSGDVLLRTLEGHTDRVTGVLALADGRFLSWSADHTLRLWDSQGTLLRNLEGHTDRVTGALALADGCFLSWSADGTLRLWAHGNDLIRNGPFGLNRLLQTASKQSEK